MPLNEIVNQTHNMRDTIWLLIAWVAGAITSILDKVLIWEKLSFIQIISHIWMAWFVWFLSSLVCDYYWIQWPWASFIVGMSWYMWVQIAQALKLFSPKVIFNLILDFINFKRWK